MIESEWQTRKKHIDKRLSSILPSWKIIRACLTLLLFVEISVRADVTVITHGLELFGSHPAWVDEMAGAIAARAGNGTVVVRVDVDESSPIFGHLEIVAINVEQGSLPLDASWNGEIVVKLFWNAVAGATDSYSSTEIAEVFAPILTEPLRSTSWTNAPLVTLPIHLIGHSRGGSVVCELALQLAEHNIWVDHLTTLDPHPAAGLLDGVFAVDVGLTVPENVTFAENYYQTGDVPSGESLVGSTEIRLNARGFFGHSDIHTWYLGTITATNIGLDYWYKTNDFGFKLSAIEKGRILRERISTNYSGVGLRWKGAQRTKVQKRSNPIWPNVDLSEPAEPFFLTGSKPQLAYRYNAKAGAIVVLAVTEGRNPYDADRSEYKSILRYTNIATDQVSVDAPETRIEEQFNGKNLLAIAVDLQDPELIRFQYSDAPLTAESLKFLAIQLDDTNLLLNVNGNGTTPFRVEGSTNFVGWKSLGIVSNSTVRMPVDIDSVPNVFLRAIAQ